MGPHVIAQLIEAVALMCGVVVFSFVLDLAIRKVLGED